MKLSKGDLNQLRQIKRLSTFEYHELLEFFQNKK